MIERDSANHQCPHSNKPSLDLKVDTVDRNPRRSLCKRCMVSDEYEKTKNKNKKVPIVLDGLVLHSVVAVCRAVVV